MTQQQLIEYYEKRLEKVKMLHSPEKETSCLIKERCNRYIEQAEKDLQEVREGRNW